MCRRARALTVPLAAAEQEQVQLAATAAGKTLDDFVPDAVLAGANDPYPAELEQAAHTIAARARAEAPARLRVLLTPRSRAVPGLPTP